jgi:hypothetical protein
MVVPFDRPGELISWADHRQAGGMLGSARVVKAPPDGYTMVIGTTADAINQTLYKAPLLRSTWLPPA